MLSSLSASLSVFLTLVFLSSLERHMSSLSLSDVCVFSVLHCAEGAFDAASKGTPKLKMGHREMSSKMVVLVALKRCDL